MIYFLTILKHKWYVLKYGLKLKCPLGRLLLHDLSKFHPKEFKAYNNYFFGDKSISLKLAYLHHQNHNDHHWEYWIDREYNRPIEMDIEAVTEMIADWFSACRVYEGHEPKAGKWTWLQKTKVFSKLHPNTEALVVRELMKQGFEKNLMKNKYIDWTNVWTNNTFMVMHKTI